MSSENRNRGKEGRDDLLFGKASNQEKIREAVSDLSFLLERGYGMVSTCKLVGNRYKLNNRQQSAVRGMSASQSSVKLRTDKLVKTSDLNDSTLVVDGFNVLIILESMLSEAYIFRGKDGAYRDLSNLHGSYKKVRQTHQAIELVGEFFKKFKIKKMHWVLDKPISNSGKMKTEILELAEKNNWNWQVDLDFSPDKILAESNHIGVSSDAWILENIDSWFNLIEVLIPDNYSFLIDCS